MPPYQSFGGRICPSVGGMCCFKATLRAPGTFPFTFIGDLLIWICLRVVGVLPKSPHTYIYIYIYLFIYLNIYIYVCVRNSDLPVDLGVPYFPFLGRELTRTETVEASAAALS